MDWENNVISFRRRKTGQLSQVHFDGEVEAVLKALPQSGPLFPYLRRVRAGDRSTEFKQRSQPDDVSASSSAPIGRTARCRGSA